MRRSISISNLLVLLIAMVLLFVGIRYILNQPERHRSTPSDWQIWFPEFDVNAMAEQDSVLWIGGKKGIRGLNIYSEQVVFLPDGGQDLKYVSGLATDPAGQLWIAHANGLCLIRGENMLSFDMEDGLPDNRVNTVYCDRSGRLWIGTWGGAAWLDNDQWVKVNGDPGLIHPMVNVIFQDQSYGMWFGSYVAPRGGLSYLNSGNWYHWSTDNGLPHPNVTSIIQNNDNIWVGTGLYNRGGAMRIELSGKNPELLKTSVLNSRDGLAGDKVRSLFADANENIWFGFEYSGISVLKHKDFHNISHKQGLSNNEVKCFLKNPRGLWIGTRKGLTLIEALALHRLME